MNESMWSKLTQNLKGQIISQRVSLRTCLRTAVASTRDGKHLVSMRGRVKVSAFDKFYFVTLIRRLIQLSKKHSDTCVILNYCFPKFTTKTREANNFSLSAILGGMPCCTNVFSLVYTLIEDESPIIYLIKPVRTSRQASRTD